MSVSNLVTKNTYLGNAATKTYPYTFLLPDNDTSFIHCYQTKVSDGTTTEVTDFAVNTDTSEVTYPVSGNALAAEYKFTIARVIPITQMLNLVNNGPFFAQDIETSLDKAIIIAQQINETTARALKLDISTNDSISTNIPAPVPLHSLRWNADGTKLETTLDPATAVSAAEAAKAAAETAAGNADASATAAAGSAAEANEQSIIATNAAKTLTLATQEEAEAGTDNIKRMSPLRVEQQTTARLATQEEAEAGTDETKLMTPKATRQTSLSMFKNKIINGNFDIWQRGTNPTINSWGGYAADRWVYWLNGTTVNSLRQSFTIGQSEVPDNPKYYIRHIVTSNNAADGVCMFHQRIENVFTFAGKTVTLSFFAKADSNKSMGICFSQSFGSGGSPSNEVNTISPQKINLTSSWQKYTVVENIPSISGKILGTDNNSHLDACFWLDGGSNWAVRSANIGNQSGTFDIAQVQLEKGSVATEFEQRPTGLELVLCQRYYQVHDVIYTSLASGGDAGKNANTINFKVSMRTIPTVGNHPDGGSGGTFAYFGTQSPFVNAATTLYQNVGNSSFTGGYITADAEL